MQTVDVVIKDAGNTGRGDGLGGGHDMDHLGETANEEDEGVVSAGGEGKIGDEVHGDGLPWGGGDGEGVKESEGGSRGTMLVSLARKTHPDVFSNVVG